MATIHSQDLPLDDDMNFEGDSINGLVNSVLSRFAGPLVGELSRVSPRDEVA
jgi:hypothetical protein